jgi:hypothetical protein
MSDGPYSSELVSAASNRRRDPPTWDAGRQQASGQVELSGRAPAGGEIICANTAAQDGGA